MDPSLWRTHPAFALASLSPVALGVLWMVFAPTRTEWRDHRAALTAFTWFATRVLFGALVFGLLGHAGTDQTAFFLPQARHALAGELPYRDFPSAYGPLFAPLLALTVALLGAAGPFVLFVLGDLIAWRALAAAEGEESEVAWAWAALPLVWYLGIRYAQDEPLCAAFLALAWLAKRRGRSGLAGLALGIGLLATKPLFALFALPFVLAGRDRLRLLCAGAAPVLLVYGGFVAFHAPVLQPFTLEGGNFGVGPTLWCVAVLRREPALSSAAGWGPFIALASAGVWFLARRGATVSEHSVWQFGAFAALAPKFMPMYAIAWAPFLALWAAPEPARRRWLACYGAMLPLAWYLDSGPLQGDFGPVWAVIAIVGTFAIALLALVPMVMIVRSRAR